MLIALVVGVMLWVMLRPAREHKPKAPEAPKANATSVVIENPFAPKVSVLEAGEERVYLATNTKYDAVWFEVYRGQLIAVKIVEHGDPRRIVDKKDLMDWQSQFEEAVRLAEADRGK